MKTTGFTMLLAVALLGTASAQVPVYTAPSPPPPKVVAPSRVESPAPEAAPPPAAAGKRSASQLEKLASPIALHPDPLIAIMLPAAAYPIEVVQAARFVKDTNNIPKVDQQPWDENVKAVARFPDLIARMDADLNWTVELGQAFVEEPKELMDTIQALRAKAQKAGTLQSTPQQVVTVTNVVVVQTNVTQVVAVTNQIVQVQPANPEVIYVPTYPPSVYYPPPGYVYDPWAPLVSFGVGMAFGAIIANNCDWHGGCVWVGGGGAVWVGGGHGDVDIDIDNINIDRSQRTSVQAGNRTAGTGAKATQQKWQPDQGRLRSSGAPVTAQTREARGWGSGTRPTQAAAQPANTYAQRNWASTAPARQPTAPQRSPSAGVSSRPATLNTPSAGSRPSPQAARSAPSQSFSRPTPQPSSTAFSGISSGAGARDYSSRGAMSRGTMSRGGGMRGGRR